MPKPSGTMNTSDAIWIAMAWAASASLPMMPIRNTAALKMVTSKASVAPIGRPSRQ